MTAGNDLHTVEILNPYGHTGNRTGERSTHSRNFESLWTHSAIEIDRNLHTVEILNPYGHTRPGSRTPDLHTVEILNPYGHSALGIAELSTHSRNFESLWTFFGCLCQRYLHTVEILNPYGQSCVAT